MAHLKLIHANKPLTYEQQIDHFIQVIQCVTSQSIVVSIIGDVTIRKSVDTYYNAFASRLKLALFLTSRPNERKTRYVNNTTNTANKRKQEYNNPGNNMRSKAFTPETHNEPPT